MVRTEHFVDCGCGSCVVARFRERQLETEYYAAREAYGEAKKYYEKGLMRATSNPITHDYQSQYQDAVEANQ